MPNGVGRRPPLGWSSWETCGEPTCAHDNCDEAEVLSAAAALASSGLRALGWSHIVLDDCWAAMGRTAAGEITWDAARFPSGMPALADKLHAQGFSLGLYTSAGNTTCSSGGRPGGKPPGSEGHYEQDVATFSSWNLDYIKLDWCGDVSDKKEDLKAGAAAHRAFGRAVNASGRPIFLEVVAGYFYLGEAEIADYANAWRFCEDHHDKWSSTREQLACRALLPRAAAAPATVPALGAPGGWASMDLLALGGAGCRPYSNATGHGAHCPGQTDAEYTSAFAMWALTQSPIVVATDVRRLGGVMKELMANEEIISL
jgi:alpha-galactosidase